MGFVVRKKARENNGNVLNDDANNSWLIDPIIIKLVRCANMSLI